MPNEYRGYPDQYDNLANHNEASVEKENKKKKKKNRRKQQQDV